MSANRVLLIYIAVILTGLSIIYVRNSLYPDPNKKLGEDINQIKETLTKVNDKLNTPDQKLTQEVNQIKAEIALDKESKANDTPAVLGKSTALGYVKVVDNYGAIEIYQSTSFSSPIAGKIEPNKTYPIIKRQDNWLLIKLETGKEGWINNKLVSEVQPTP